MNKPAPRVGSLVKIVCTEAGSDFDHLDSCAGMIVEIEQPQFAQQYPELSGYFVYIVSVGDEMIPLESHDFDVIG